MHLYVCMCNCICITPCMCMGIWGKYAWLVHGADASATVVAAMRG